MSARATVLSPQEAVERALAAARCDDCVAIAEETSGANLRWAGNTLTTNGVSRSRQLTVIAIDRRAGAEAAGVVSRAGVRPDQIEEVVREAEHAAAEGTPAEDEAQLPGPGKAESFGMRGTEDGRWESPPDRTDIGVLRDFAAALGETLRGPRPRAASCTGSPSTSWSARSSAARPGCGCGTTSRPGESS